MSSPSYGCNDLLALSNSLICHVPLSLSSSVKLQPFNVPAKHAAASRLSSLNACFVMAHKQRTCIAASSSGSSSSSSSSNSAALAAPQHKQLPSIALTHMTGFRSLAAIGGPGQRIP